MADPDVTDDQPRAAGGFSAWLAGMQTALRGEQSSEVPCGGCTACCTSSQFVHIGPDEAETLAHIPALAAVPGAATACRQRPPRLRRERPLPDAHRRRVLDLRAPPEDVPHLRLPGLPGCRRRARRRQACDRSASPALAVRLPGRGRPARARRGTSGRGRSSGTTRIVLPEELRPGERRPSSQFSPSRCTTHSSASPWNRNSTCC